MPILTSDAIVGKREDVADKIFMISPSETPFVSSLPKKKIDNTVFSWLEQDLDAPALIALGDGAEAVDGTVTQPTSRLNYTQIIGDTVKVSTTSEAVGKYGRASEIARAVVNMGKKLMLSLEYSAVNTKQTATGGATRQFAGVQAQIDTGNVIKTGGVSTPMTEANLNAALLALYNNGATPKILMVTPTDAQTVAGFARDTGRYRELSNDYTKLFNVVSGYAGPNGTVSVVQNRVLAASDALVYDPENWYLCTLRPWTKEPLAKTGDSKRMFMVGEYSLQHNNYKASAVIRRAA